MSYQIQFKDYDKWDDYTNTQDGRDGLYDTVLEANEKIYKLEKLYPGTEFCYEEMTETSKEEQEKTVNTKYNGYDNQTYDAVMTITKYSDGTYVCNSYGYYNNDGDLVDTEERSNVSQKEMSDLWE